MKMSLPKKYVEPPKNDFEKAVVWFFAGLVILLIALAVFGIGYALYLYMGIQGPAIEILVILGWGYIKINGGTKKP